jgi:hypothetical protein
MLQVLGLHAGSLSLPFVPASLIPEYSYNSSRSAGLLLWNVETLVETRILLAHTAVGI